MPICHNVESLQELATYSPANTIGGWGDDMEIVLWFERGKLLRTPNADREPFYEIARMTEDMIHTGNLQIHAYGKDSVTLIAYAKLAFLSEKESVQQWEIVRYAEGIGDFAEALDPYITEIAENEHRYQVSLLRDKVQQKLTHLAKLVLKEKIKDHSHPR